MYPDGIGYSYKERGTEMALSNRDRVDRGISSVTAGLAPYVLRELKSRYGERWGYAVAGELGEGRYSRVQNASEEAFLESVDAHALFKVMWGCYNDAFREKLGFSGRNQLSELMEVRNSWAHNGSFNLEDTQRALDTMHRLLQAVGAGQEAEEVQGHHRAVLRQIFESDERREVKRAVREAPESREGLLPWREVVDPHPDVREGRYQEAEFAADLAEVLSGAAEPEYQDPAEFFRRTYLTQGMVGLLANAAMRLSGTGGDPVVQLQTIFGGGKTHSMLALYHLFGEEAVFGSVPDGEKVSREAGLDEMPAANRAVLVGTDLDAGKPRRHSEVTTRTLWGEMAYQLGGVDGYDYVRESDERGVAPGAGTIKQLMDDFGPALILIDEMVAFVRNIYGHDGENRLPAGTFDSNITFVQNLTEAAKRSERTLVVVSIPVSERADETGRSDVELGGEIGKLVAERLEQVLGRVESVWKPVGATEGFEIVRRRLFSQEMNAPARDAVVSAYARMYRDNRSEYPSGCVESEYERRLRSAYPIHPELFDRL